MRFLFGEKKMKNYQNSRFRLINKNYIFFKRNILYIIILQRAISNCEERTVLDIMIEIG